MRCLLAKETNNGIGTGLHEIAPMKMIAFKKHSFFSPFDSNEYSVLLKDNRHCGFSIRGIG